MANEVDRLEEFENLYEAAVEMFDSQLDEDVRQIDIRDRVLSHCLKDQVALQMAWEEVYRDVEYLYLEVSDECDRMFSIAFRELTGNSYKQLSVTEAKLYAQSDRDYCDTRRVLNKIKVLKGKIEGVMESIKTRRFMLKGITDALQAGNDGYII